MDELAPDPFLEPVAAAAPAAAEPVAPEEPESRASSCWSTARSCLGALLGLALMGYAEWLSVSKEAAQREFFAGEERREEVAREVRESLERARASRTPINFADLWEDPPRPERVVSGEPEAEGTGEEPSPTPEPSPRPGGR